MSYRSWRSEQRSLYEYDDTDSSRAYSQCLCSVVVTHGAGCWTGCLVVQDREHERLEKDRGRELQAKIQYTMGALDLDALHMDEEISGHVCKVCFEAPTAAVLLPCRHFCCELTDGHFVTR